MSGIYRAFAAGRYVFFYEKRYRNFPINVITVLHELTHILFWLAEYPVPNVENVAVKLYEEVERGLVNEFPKEFIMLCAHVTNHLISHYPIYKFLLERISELRDEIEQDLYEHLIMYFHSWAETKNVHNFALQIPYYVIIHSLEFSDEELKKALVATKLISSVNELSRIVEGINNVRKEGEYREVLLSIFNTVFDFLKHVVKIKQ
jgi:hypothetical protein